MKYNFDEIIDRTNTGSDKYDRCKRVFGRDDIIPLWIADMDFRVARPITDAIVKRTEHGIFGYTFQTHEYLNSIINWKKRRFGWELKKEWLSFAPGIVPGLNFAVQCMTEPGDKVVVMTPVYNPFFDAIINNDRVLVKSPLKRDGLDYTMDFDDLDKKLADAKMLIFCSPHNPVGRVWTREELEKLAAICVKHKIKLVSDEIHSDLLYPPYEHISIASLSEELADNCITFFAPSKTFNIAGLATGVAVASNKEIYDKYHASIKTINVERGNVYGLVALETAYNYGEEWLSQALLYLSDNATFVIKFLEQNLPQIKAKHPEGTYLLWMDCSGLNLSQDKLVDFMVNDAKVGLNNGEMFGKSEGTGFMRMNLACPRSVLEKAMNQILEAYKAKLS